MYPIAPLQPIYGQSHRRNYWRSYWRNYLGLRLSLSGFMVAVAIATAQRGIAQTPPASPTSLTGPAVEQLTICQQYDNEFNEPLLTVLMERFTLQLTQGHYAAAAATYRQAAERVRQLPNLDSRSGQFIWLTGANLDGQSDQWLERITELGQEGQGDILIAALDEAVQIAHTLEGEQEGQPGREHRRIRTQGLAMLARAYQQLDRLDRVRTVLVQAESSYHVDQGPLALLAIAQIYQSLGDTERVQTLLRQAQRQAEALSEPSAKAMSLEFVAVVAAQVDQRQIATAIATSLTPNPLEQPATILEAIAQSYLRAQQPEQATAIATTISNRAIAARTLSQIARYYAAQRGDNARAATLFVDAARWGNEANEAALAAVLSAWIEWYPDAAAPQVQAFSDPYQQVPLLGHLASHYAEIGQPEQAEAALTQLKATLAGLDPVWQEIFTQSIIEQAMQRRAHVSALWLAQELTPSTPTLRSSVLRQWVIPELYNRSELPLLEAAVHALPDDDLNLKTASLMTLAAAYVQTDRVEQALALLPTPAEDDRPALLRWVQVQAAIAREQVLSYSLDAGQERFRQIQVRAIAIPDLQTRATALGWLAIALSQARQPVDADLLSALTDTLQSLSASGQGELPAEILDGLIALRRYDLAMAIAQALNSDPNSSNRQEYLIAQLTEGAIKAEQYQLAEQMIGQIQHARSRVLRLLELSDRYFLDGNMQDAAAQLETAVATTLTIAGDESIDIPAGVDGLTSLADAGDRGSLLAAIALRYKRLGYPLQGLATAALIQDSASRDRVHQWLQCAP